MEIGQSGKYKKEIADLYSRRSHTYHSSAWHDRMARKLVDFANIKPDSQLLDIATGTGMVAFHAASKLGPLGFIIGIDISEGMIGKATSKLGASQLSNVHFELADGEALSFAPSTFDLIFCGSAFIWMTDLKATLTHWRSFLKSNSKVGFHAFSETSFITGVVAQSVLQKYEANYLMNKSTGTAEKFL